MAVSQYPANSAQVVAIVDFGATYATGGTYTGTAHLHSSADEFGETKVMQLYVIAGLHTGEYLGPLPGPALDQDVLLASSVDNVLGAEVRSMHTLGDTSGTFTEPTRYLSLVARPSSPFNDVWYSDGLSVFTATPSGTIVASPIAVSADLAAGAAPRLVVEYFTNNSSTFGPQTLDGVVHDALTVGWSWYSRYPANAYFTLRQDSVHNTRLLPLLHHIRISYVNPATGYRKVVFTGRLGDPNSTGDDVVWTAWNYLAELSLSRTGYRTLYPVKALGTEIVTPEWTAARTATFALLNFVTTGTIQDPLGTDAVTVIKTDTRFGVIDVPRLLLFFDLSEIGRANTVNNVTFEITREAPFTFNFWKNKGSAYAAQRITLPGSAVDYQFVPGFSALRNDLATIGTTATGAATEIVKTDEANASVYGRRQDVFTIKTLAGLSGAATEADAQVAITARAVKEATTLQKSIAINLKLGVMQPFDGWDLEDTVRVQIARGRDSIDADYRIVGMRAVQDERGYHPTILLQLPTVA